MLYANSKITELIAALRISKEENDHLRKQETMHNDIFDDYRLKLRHHVDYDPQTGKSVVTGND